MAQVTNFKQKMRISFTKYKMKLLPHYYNWDEKKSSGYFENESLEDRSRKWVDAVKYDRGQHCANVFYRGYIGK